MFSEPTYPIWEHRQPLYIPLIDTSKYPAYHHLSPLSGKDIATLKKYINKWLELSRTVLSTSPYGHPVLFSEKKGGGVCLYVNYNALNV